MYVVIAVCDPNDMPLGAWTTLSAARLHAGSVDTQKILCMADTVFGWEIDEIFYVDIWELDGDSDPVHMGQNVGVEWREKDTE